MMSLKIGTQSELGDAVPAPRSQASWSMFRRPWLALLLALVMPLITGPRLANAAVDSQYKAVSGVAVYIGILPAEMIKGHPKSHPESTMHNGKPSGRHEYHLVVALFDDKTGARIENATVRATPAGVGLAGERIDLEPMSIANTVTYGGFADLPNDLYTIKVTIRLPDRAEPIAVDFQFDHRLGPPRKASR